MRWIVDQIHQTFFPFTYGAEGRSSKDIPSALSLFASAEDGIHVLPAVVTHLKAARSLHPSTIFVAAACIGYHS
jgi:hypothetical protein